MNDQVEIMYGLASQALPKPVGMKLTERGVEKLVADLTAKRAIKLGDGWVYIGDAPWFLFPAEQNQVVAARAAPPVKLAVN